MDLLLLRSLPFGCMLFLALFLTFSAADTTGVYIYYNQADGKGTYYWYNIDNEPAQRCYSFTCYGSDVTSIEWKNVQEVSSVSIYSLPDCRGPPIIRRNEPSGEYFSEDLARDFTIHSFEVWESTMFSTRGLVDLCPTEDERALRNSSELEL